MNAPLTPAMTAPPAPPVLALQDAIDTASLLLNPVVFQQIDAFASIMASGVATVPKHLQKNKADCMAVTLQALQWRKNPYGVAQKTHVVHGTLGYESQLIISIVNTSGAIVGSLEFEWFGEWDRITGRFKEVTSRKKTNEDTGEPLTYRVPDWTLEDEKGLYVVCRAALRHTPGRVRELKLMLTQARTRNSTLWADDPQMQLAYLAGKKWARLNCPEVILGMYSPDELEQRDTPRDMGVAEVVEPTGNGGTRAQALSVDEIDAWKEAASKGTAAARAWFARLGKERRALVPDKVKTDVWAIADKADQQRTVDAAAAAAAAGSGSAGAATSGASAEPAPPGGVDPFVADIEAAERAQAAGQRGAA